MPRIALSLVVLCSFTLHLAAQTAQTPPQQSRPRTPVVLEPVSKDPEVVQLLNQVLSVAGGIDAVKALTDYTASGTITYYSDLGLAPTNAVTVRGRQRGSVRLDETLETGTRSQVIAEVNTNAKDEKGQVSQLRTQGPMNPSSLVLPYLPLRGALNGSAYGLSDTGMETVDGRSVHHIQTWRALPVAAVAQGIDSRVAFGARDYFIDAASSQILMTQDVGPKGIVRRVHYADYRPQAGILAPFLIVLEEEGQVVWTIHLNQVVFNSNLPDSAFQLAQ